MNWYYLLGAKMAAESMDAQVLRKSRLTLDRLHQVASRERARWTAAGVPEVQQTGSLRTGLVLPDDVSDLDMNIPHDGNVAQLQSILTAGGAPFRADHGSHVRHRYTTPEGVKVDVSVRPRKHVEHLVRGLDRIAALPVEERNRLLLDKYNVHRTGDRAAYEAWKQSLLETHGVLPPGGDWSKLAAVKTASAAELVDRFRDEARAKGYSFFALAAKGDDGASVYNAIGNDTAANAARAAREAHMQYEQRHGIDPHHQR